MNSGYINKRCNAGAKMCSKFLPNAFCKIIEFILANLVCYAINVAWVFEPGRHSRHKEIMLFFGVSLVGFVLGTALGTGLIIWFNAGAVTAYVANLVAAVLINYAGRKYYVFKN